MNVSVVYTWSWQRIMRPWSVVTLRSSCGVTSTRREAPAGTKERTEGERARESPRERRFAFRPRMTSKAQAREKERLIKSRTRKNSSSAQRPTGRTIKRERRGETGGRGSRVRQPNDCSTTAQRRSDRVPEKKIRGGTGVPFGEIRDGVSERAREREGLFFIPWKNRGS